MHYHLCGRISYHKVTWSNILIQIYVVEYLSANLHDQIV